MAHLPNQPPVLRTKQQNKDDFEELGLGGDDGAAQDESPDSEEGSVEAPGLGSDPESEDAAPIQHCIRVRSGMTLGGGVGQRRHGRPSWSHCALPYLFCVAVSMISQDY